MSIPFIHISTHIQEGPQAGEPLWLFAGKIQWTALMDLLSSIQFINKPAEETHDTDMKAWVTVYLPGLSSQCLLPVPPAASPCLACSSKLLYGEDCSTTLGLESRNTHSSYTNFRRKINNFFLQRLPRYVNGFQASLMILFFSVNFTLRNDYEMLSPWIGHIDVHYCFVKICICPVHTCSPAVVRVFQMHYTLFKCIIHVSQVVMLFGILFPPIEHSSK